MPSYNHTREDSPLLPCPLCARTDTERALADELRRTREAHEEELEEARRASIRETVEYAVPGTVLIWKVRADRHVRAVVVSTDDNDQGAALVRKIEQDRIQGKKDAYLHAASEVLRLDPKYSREAVAEHLRNLTALRDDGEIDPLPMLNRERWDRTITTGQKYIDDSEERTQYLLNIVDRLLEDDEDPDV